MILFFVLWNHEITSIYLAKRNSHICAWNVTESGTHTHTHISHGSKREKGKTLKESCDVEMKYINWAFNWLLNRRELFQKCHEQLSLHPGIEISSSGNSNCRLIQVWLICMMKWHIRKVNNVCSTSAMQLVTNHYLDENPTRRSGPLSLNQRLICLDCYHSHTTESHLHSGITILFLVFLEEPNHWQLFSFI